MKLLKKNLKGTALFTVLCVMTVLAMILVFSFLMLGVAQKKAKFNYYNNQSYVSAKTVVDIYTQYLVSGDTDACIAGVNGIGITARDKLRKQLTDLTVNANKWYVLSNDALDGTTSAGMGKVKLEVKKETASTYIIRATGIKKDASGSSEKSEAVVTKTINLVPQMGMGLFENSIISCGSVNLGSANSLILGGVVSLLNTGTVSTQTGIGVVGDFYSETDVTLTSGGFALSQNKKEDSSVPPPNNIIYDIDTMEVKGNLKLDTSSGKISIFNAADTTLAGNWTKGTTPYILVQGNLTVDVTADVFIGYNKMDSLRFGDSPRDGWVLPQAPYTLAPIDIYVTGNVTIINTNNRFYHCGTIHYGGTFSDPNHKYVNANGVAPINDSMTKPFSTYTRSDYKPVNTDAGVTGFMQTTVTTTNGVTTTPNALKTAALGSAPTITGGGSQTISSSAILKDLDNKILTIDISGMDNTANPDLWFELQQSAYNPGHFTFGNNCEIYINYGSVAVDKRVNLYFYSENLEVDFNKVKIGLDKRTDTNTDPTSQHTTGIGISTYKTLNHHYGSTSNPGLAETPGNVYFICDKGKIKLTNDCILKGYIYAPDADIDQSNGEQGIDSWYNGIEYTTTRKASVVGSIIGKMVSGNFNDGTVAYVKPHNSLLSSASPQPPTWTDPGTYNNH